MFQCHSFFYEATCIHVKTSLHTTRCIDPSLGMNGCSRLTWCPRIIPVWEAVGLHQLEALAVLVGHCCKGDCSLFYGDRVVFVPPTKVTSSPLNTVIPKISH